MRKASAKGWAIIGVLAALVVVALGWTMLIAPLRDQTGAVQEEAAAQIAANATAQDTVARLEKQAARLPAAKAQLEGLRSTIPADEEIPTLVRQINGAAVTAGVTLDVITPASAVPVAVPAAGGALPVGGLQEVPLAISVTGTYVQTQAFLAALESLQRGVLVRGIDLAEAPGAEEGQVHTAIRAGVFINPNLGTPVQAPAPAAPDAGTDPATPAGDDAAS